MNIASSNTNDCSLIGFAALRQAGFRGGLEELTAALQRHGTGGRGGDDIRATNASASKSHEIFKPLFKMNYSP